MEKNVGPRGPVIPYFQFHILDEEGRKSLNVRAIPVVVVTSSREDPDIETAYALGANSYVVKPVGFDAFLDAMSSPGLYWLLMNQPPS